MRISDTIALSPPTAYQSALCEPCLEGPLALGLCCPDALPEPEVDYGRYTGCMDNMNYAVVRCPDDWPEASVRLKCENRNNPDDPVSDLLAGVSYRNEHCAICHKAQRTVPWTVEVLCQHLQFLYMVLTEEELLRRAAQLPNICKIGLAPPRGVQSRSCENDMEWLGDDVVDRCNVTGLWEKYDRNIAELCEKYTALSFRVDAEVKIHDLRYVRFVDNKLQVCLEVLNHLPTRRGGHKGGSRKLSWQYILSMTCIPLSIFCLAVTVLVYAVLKVLRTEPGLNTLGTCCTLLLAQLSLLLASHRVLDGAWCVALGMFVHLSWLSTFLWTSVCSVHMFRVFSAKTFSGSGEASYGKLARNVAVTLLGPCVVVAVVIALSYITSGGASIGYSSSKCYLDSSLLVGVAMVLPVAFIVTLNLVLFTLTVFRIRKVTMLQVHARNDPDATLQHVDACARLSLLTGTTWVLSLLAEGLDLDWLRAVSILANGGQGVLLFMSYVTRRRVVTMLAARMGCRKDDTSLSTGATTAAKRMTSNEEDRPYVIGE
nr:hypothetical protein BaRGS_030528 [Batillaria attramentaria]